MTFPSVPGVILRRFIFYFPKDLGYLGDGWVDFLTQTWSFTLYILFYELLFIRFRLNDFFYHINSKNYCEDHKDVSLKHCNVCLKGISDEGLQIGDKYFHMDCFKCATCNDILREIYYTTSTGYLCKDDYLVSFTWQLCAYILIDRSQLNHISY